MSYALITGPTAGIGKALAYQLAEKGYNLLLVARREDRLIQISEDIKDKFNVEVLFTVEDLTNSQAPERIYDFTISKALDIELLILKEINLISKGLYQELNMTLTDQRI